MARAFLDIPQPCPSDDGAIQRILTFLESSHSQYVDTNTMAKAAGCSRRTLARVTRSHWGCTPREVIAMYRIQRARDLLRQGWKVEAAALAVGYRSRINFYRTFRRILGTTPGERRARSGD